MKVVFTVPLESVMLSGFGQMQWVTSMNVDIAINEKDNMSGFRMSFRINVSARIIDIINYDRY